MEKNIILQKKIDKTFIQEKQDKINKKIKKEKIQKGLGGLIARSVLIQDTKSGEEIFSKNKDNLLPIASLTKIVNAIVLLESQSKKVILTKRALKVTGDYGLVPYEEFEKKDAIDFMLIGSVNDIASAAAFGYKNIVQNWFNFLHKMNVFVKRENMLNTIFFSENGLDINSHIQGSYSTTVDIAKIVKYFYIKFPERARETVSVEKKICSNKKCHFVQNTNILLGKYPEIVFSKTGYTQKSEGALSVVVHIKGKNYTIIILGSTKQGRFDDLEKIINFLKQQ